ncbi:hypothetical protein ACGF7W_34340 [Streptomyces sp. NPDC048219]|uniref:hypothetical protein n=1 Tax=Streptomyces TaxID=1883 RepID=UPI003711692F
MTHIVTVGFHRPVHVHELRPGDVFAFPDAPHTALTVIEGGRAPVSAELTLVVLTLAGCDGPLSLPATTHVRPLRLLRSVSLTCLLCSKEENVELNLPQDGEPLAFVCDNHDGEQAAA